MGLGRWSPLCIPGPQGAHTGNSPLPAGSPHPAQHLVVPPGPSSLQSPAWGGAGAGVVEAVRGGQQLPCPVPRGGTEEPLGGRGCPFWAEASSHWLPAAELVAPARPVSGVQELRTVHPWAVSGEWWVTFEHRYQTVLESSQEIQHCPVRCPQRPRCASAQNHVAPTDQAGWRWWPSKDPGLHLGWTRPAERF